MVPNSVRDSKGIVRRILWNRCEMVAFFLPKLLRLALKT